jgi:hypothetical protein
VNQLTEIVGIAIGGIELPNARRESDSPSASSSGAIAPRLRGSLRSHLAIPRSSGGPRGQRHGSEFLQRISGPDARLHDVTSHPQSLGLGLRLILGLEQPPEPLPPAGRNLLHGMRLGLAGWAVCVIALVFMVVFIDRPEVLVIAGLVCLAGGALMLVAGLRMRRAVKEIRTAA